MKKAAMALTGRCWRHRGYLGVWCPNGDKGAVATEGMDANDACVVEELWALAGKGQRYAVHPWSQDRAEGVAVRGIQDMDSLVPLERTETHQGTFFSAP